MHVGPGSSPEALCDTPQATPTAETVSPCCTERWLGSWYSHQTQYPPPASSARRGVQPSGHPGGIGAMLSTPAKAYAGL